MELLRALDEILKVTPFKVFLEGNTCILQEPYSQYKNGLKFKHLKCGGDCSLHVHCHE
jgi:hypothetical protein